MSEQLSLTEPPRPESITDGLTEAHAIADRAEAEHGPIFRKYLLVSGGNDSMVLLDAFKDVADAVVHVNTGIGIPETTEFVRKVVAGIGIEFHELHPPVPYRDLVLGRWLGFPGPGRGHQFAYTMLKQRPIEAFLAERRERRGQRFALIAGVRNAESRRRMAYSDPVRRKGGQVWVNPLLRWSDQLMQAYRRQMQLPVNPVTQHLHMSGECLCGAFAHPGELNEIAFFYPDFAARIRALEGEAKAAGLRNCKWGERPPRREDAAAGPMCQSCTLFNADDEAAAQFTPKTA